MTMSGYVYVCSAGETFDSVALGVYGNEKYACELLTANPALCGRAVFSGMERLRLPVVEVPESGDDEQYELASAPWKE